MKCRTSLIAAAAAMAIGLTAFAPDALAQPAAGAQPADPTTQTQPSQQPMPGEEPAVEPSSSSGPSATSVAPKESSAATLQEAPSATGPDARSSVTMAGPSTGADRRLAAVTPPGMSTQEACLGFKSIAECAAAMHAAQNLSIPFGDLKSRLTGGEKLGAAIHGLKPEADAAGEASRAENQARSDVDSSQG